VLGNQRSEAEGAEDITYAARAIEALCAQDWPSQALCGGLERERCFACESDSQCRDDWTCAAHEGNPDQRFCAAGCQSDADCRSDHQCAQGTCLPRLETVCYQGSPWTQDSCGRPIAQLEACQDAQFCFDGGCVERGPGDTCADPLVLEPLAQQTLNLSFAGRYDADSRGSCAGGGAEVVYELTVDRPRMLRATATGTDPVLYLRSTCGDADSEVACNDDNTPPGGTGSRLELEIEPGTYYLFADTFRGSGEIELEVEVLPICEVYCDLGATRCDEAGQQVETCLQEEGAECADWVADQACEQGQFCREGACLTPEPGDTCQDAVELEAINQRVVDDLRGAWNDSDQGTCGGNGPDAVYTFTVEEPVQLSALAAGMDSVLYLRRGACDGEEVACNDDSDPPGSQGSLITPQLSPGTYYLFVDSFSQDRARRFGLNLEFSDPCEDACQEGERRCDPDQGAAAQICQATTQGCLGWGDPIVCDEGFACLDGFCTPACEDTCQEGETRCDQDAVQRCGDFNQDGCLEWSASVACPSGQSCVEDACTDEDATEPDMGTDADMGTDGGQDLWPNPFEDAGTSSSGKKDDGCQAVPGAPSPLAGLWLLALGLLWRRRQP
jgi:MYXO-CTERM domain-containing protein